MAIVTLQKAKSPESSFTRFHSCHPGSTLFIFFIGISHFLFDFYLFFFFNLIFGIQNLSINDEKISSQNLTVVHDIDSGESIESAAIVNNTKTVAIDEQTIANTAAADETSCEIVKSIAEEIVEKATKAVDSAAQISDAQQTIESKSCAPSLMQDATPENIVLPTQEQAPDTTPITTSEQ